MNVPPSYSTYHSGEQSHDGNGLLLTQLKGLRQ